MSDARTITGIVLAGGRSSRFGADKLALELDGRPLLHHAVEAVAAVAGAVLVVVAPGTSPDLPPDLRERARLVHDPRPFGGPLLGLEVALDDASSGVAIVVGGDMPWMVTDVLRRLADAVTRDHSAAILEVPGRVQPLPTAVDVVAAREAAGRVREHGGRSLRDLLAELQAVALPAPTWLALDPAGRTIRDVDRPEDLREDIPL